MRGVFCLALGLFAIVCFGPVLAAENEKAESLYFALVLNGRHTGYMEMTITPGNTAGAPTVTVQEMVQKVKTLGTTTTVTYRSTRETAPGSGKVLSVDSEVTQGSRKTGSTLIFKDGEVFVTPKPEGEVKTLKINSATIVDDGISFPYLLKDFSDQNVKTKIYPVLDTMRNEIIERIYTRGGPAKVKLAGRIFECLVFESADKKIGVRGKVWVDTATGRAVRTENSMGVITYLADKSYKKRFLSGEPIDKVETVKPKAPTAELQPVGEVPWKVGESYQYLYTYGDKSHGYWHGAYAQAATWARVRLGQGKASGDAGAMTTAVAKLPDNTAEPCLRVEHWARQETRGVGRASATFDAGETLPNGKQGAIVLTNDGQAEEAQLMTQFDQIGKRAGVRVWLKGTGGGARIALRATCRAGFTWQMILKDDSAQWRSVDMLIDRCQKTHEDFHAEMMNDFSPYRPQLNRLLVRFAKPLPAIKVGLIEYLPQAK